MVSATTADVVVYGAGIAGIAAAYHLAVRRGVTDVLLVDERAPLSLTSDKSTECYRNWWPGRGDDMVALMNRSIDLLEELARESFNAFRITAAATSSSRPTPSASRRSCERPRKRRRAAWARPARPGSDYRPAPADGFEDQPTGTDVITDAGLIRKHFPSLAHDVVAELHARRCGCFSGQELGMYLLERAREKGARLVEGRVERVEVAGERVRGVTVGIRNGARTISTPRFVNAPGPFLRPVGRLLGVELPVFCQRHAKVGVRPYHAREARTASDRTRKLPRKRRS